MTEGYDGLAPELLVEKRGALRVVTMNRPDALNAINLRLHKAITVVWELLSNDAEARAVILTGAGRAFSAGGDLHHIQDLQRDDWLRREDMVRAAAIVRGMTECPLPIVAAVNGPAVGLGATVALLSDIVLMAESAYLSDPHVSVGLTAADGGVSIWPWLAGLSRAKEYLLTGDRIGPQLAVQFGLASRVVPDLAIFAEAVALAERLARQPKLAVQSTKLALNEHLRHAVGSILDEALEVEARCFDEAEHQSRVEKLIARESAQSGDHER
jgi:enoyl-CoA hydratase